MLMHTNGIDVMNGIAKYQSCGSGSAVFGPPGSGSGSISARYGSGSGSFYQVKIVRKTLIPTVL